MPMIETVRTIPVILENSPRKFAPDKMETEEISGYPFERNPDEGFRTQLDDIAKRHPELAEHLNTFQQRDRARSDTSTFPRRLPRHFGRGFEGFSGFPFDNEDLGPREFQQEHHQPHQEAHQGFHQEPHQEFYQQQPEKEEKVGKEKGSNIQQSSTIDLGQKQEPINDRSKRSMSAPPAEKSETNLNQETMSNHNKPSTTNERIIPIHIEGRDEPVLPRNVNQTYTQQPPQPDRIFGQRPEQFTQFLNRDSGPRYNNWQQQQQQPHPEDQHHRQGRQDIPIPVQREVPVQKKQQQQQQKAPQPQRGASPQPEASKQNQQQQQQQQQSKQPQQQSKQPSTPLDQIQAIQRDVLELMAQVEAFDGKTKNKQYLYLDEMLTRNLIKLDNVDTQGQETIRSARKEAIKCIERAISILEAKATAGSEEKMEVEKQEEEQQQQEEQDQKESMEIENSDNANKEMEVEVPKEENKGVDVEEEGKKEEEEVKNIEEVSNMSVGEAVKIFEEKNNRPENTNNESSDNKQQEAEANDEMKKESEAANKDENVDCGCDTKKEEEKNEVAQQDGAKKEKEKKKGKKKVVDKKESK